MILTPDFLVGAVKRMMGWPHVRLEISDDEILAHSQVALLNCSPYYSGTSMVQKTYTGGPLDLTADGVIEVVNVYETQTNLATIADPMAYFAIFGDQPLTGPVSSAQFNAVDYAINAYRRSEIQLLLSRNFRFVNGILYVSNIFSSDLVLECIKDLRALTDITEEFYMSWILKYTLALTKLSVGETRRKFTASSGPFTIDGEALVSEATSALQELDQQLSEGKAGFFCVMR